MTQLSEVRISTDVGSYAITSSCHGCTGIVSWSNGESSFPDDRWNDFALVIAGWWLQALSQLQSSNRSVVFRFMDGPFCVECDRIGDMVHGRFVDDRRGRKVVTEWTTPYCNIVQQVVEFSKVVLSYCDRNGVDGSDVDLVRSGLETM
jgi:hypothetical protein